MHERRISLISSRPPAASSTPRAVVVTCTTEVSCMYVWTVARLVSRASRAHALTQIGGASMNSLLSSLLLVLNDSGLVIYSIIIIPCSQCARPQDAKEGWWVPRGGGCTGSQNNSWQVADARTEVEPLASPCGSRFTARLRRLDGYAHAHAYALWRMYSCTSVKVRLPSDARFRKRPTVL